MCQDKLYLPNYIVLTLDTFVEILNTFVRNETAYVKDVVTCRTSCRAGMEMNWFNGQITHQNSTDIIKTVLNEHVGQEKNIECKSKCKREAKLKFSVASKLFFLYKYTHCVFYGMTN